jgi:hypothetical protein
MDSTYILVMDNGKVAEFKELVDAWEKEHK